ncbi:MAG: hypothetical protein ACOXZ5_02070 [Syntrophomonadaceae bacterium]
MLIVIRNWKKKCIRMGIVITLIIAFAVAAPALTGLFHHYIPALGGWFEDEHPSGNPMRVEGDTKFDRALDQFVIKLQKFYHEDNR